MRGGGPDSTDVFIFFKKKKKEGPWTCTEERRPRERCTLREDKGKTHKEKTATWLKGCSQGMPRIDSKSQKLGEAKRDSPLEP